MSRMLLAQVFSKVYLCLHLTCIVLNLDVTTERLQLSVKINQTLINEINNYQIYNVFAKQNLFS